MHVLENLAYNAQNAGDLYLPEEETAAAVLTIHGGGWSSMDRRSMNGVAEFLCGAGLAVFNVDYRLAPEHRYPAGLEDCRDALRWLQKRDPRFPGLFVLGASAGGHYALLTGLTAARGSVRGIISVSGINDVFADFRFAPERYEVLLGHRPDPEELKRLDPASHWTGDAPPVLCTHCRHDEVVPYAATLDFERKISGPKSDFTLYGYDFGREHQGHAIWIPDSRPHKLYPDIEQAILQFIRKKEQHGRTI